MVIWLLQQRGPVTIVACSLTIPDWFFATVLFFLFAVAAAAVLRLLPEKKDVETWRRK